MENFFDIEIDSFGLEISGSSLRLAKLEKGKNELSLVSLGNKSIDERYVYNGKVENEDLLAEAIKELLNEVSGKKIKKRHVILSLPEEKSFLKIIKMPMMKKEDLMSAVKYEAENHLPFPITNFYLDFRIISPISKNKKYVSILLAAMPKEIIDGYVSVLKKSNLTPLLIETNPFSVVRALINEKKEKNSLLFINAEKNKLTFIIFSGGVIRFASSVNLNLDLVSTEDESMCVETLFQEIQKYLNYHSKNFRYDSEKKENIKKIIFSGNLEIKENLFTELFKKLKIDIEKGNPLCKIKNDFVESIDKKSIYTGVIGAALRQHDEFNKI